jgi:formylglycine-generating enzyme required for sulfatase activity
MLLLASLFAFCKKDTPVTGVHLTPSSLALTLVIDETATLKVTVFPENATHPTVTWQSSAPTVVTVNNGQVIAKGEGTAIITVTTKDGNFTATCTVSVTQPHPAETELITVEGGTFTMGCTDGDCYTDGREGPAHQVTLSSFKMAKYEVTIQQWEELLGTFLSFPFPGENIPAHYISWNDAQEFITKLNEVTGKKYRLPTEAEWEYAARGGNKSKGYKYSGSNDIEEVAWYYSNSNARPQPVGTKAPNELGIYDMSGNVWECCSDWYGYYSSGSQTDPTGPSGGEFRVSRGGGFTSGEVISSATDLRVSNRARGHANYRYLSLGLRLVLPIL